MSHLLRYTDMCTQRERLAATAGYQLVTTAFELRGIAVDTGSACNGTTNQMDDARMG